MIAFIILSAITWGVFYLVNKKKFDNDVKEFNNSNKENNEELNDNNTES